MRTMRKFIWISLIVLIGCQSRKSEVLKESEKQTEKQTSSIVDNSQINADLSKNTITENATGSTTSDEKKETVNQEELKEAISQKATAETSGKSLKRKTYFENGNLKSETDYTENFSKIESENENLKTKITTQTEIITDLKSANTSLQRISDNQKITITEERKLSAKFQKENTDLKESKNKKTEKEGLPWYYIVIITVLVWEILRVGIKKGLFAVVNK